MKHHGEQESRRRKGRARARIMLVPAFLCAVFILTLLLFCNGDGGDAADRIAVDTADGRPNNATCDHAPEESRESEASPSPAVEADWSLTLVNKLNPLPEDYPVTLVEVPGGERVDERIYEPLMEMLEAAREGNWDQLPTVVSGYRTQEKQQRLYDEKVAEYRLQGYSEEEAVERASQWVALPGHSEHQLGIAVDINGATYDLYSWLQENSYKYGFIFRYQAGKTDITGTAEEVWHYRYVGTEAATEMYEQGLCLEEYLEKTNP